MHRSPAIFATRQQMHRLTGKSRESCEAAQEAGVVVEGLQGAAVEVDMLVPAALAEPMALTLTVPPLRLTMPKVELVPPFASRMLLFTLSKPELTVATPVESVLNPRLKLVVPALNCAPAPFT